MENRMIKTPDEILKIMKAEAMGDMCFSHILDFIKVGMTELEVAGEIERVLLALGAEGLSFPTICVSGTRTEFPHGEPTDKVIMEGDLVTIDMGAVVDGYCGDMTRTVAMNYIRDDQQEVYDVVLRSQEAGLAAVKSGVRCFDVDKVCRDIIADAGYGEYYIHGTGHGVGTEVHEAPTLNTKSDEVLAEYMPVTIEPGIYIPGNFGVRIEDLAIVTDFGIINTTKSCKELIIL
ncbi:aminopeptidase P family protein [Ihubacter massiliensis]|uniref:Aminopeptidase P family protein n=1 Tax=Hominibacterium faecale TaxID=2839743 RepID=A0A9J6QL57_9FIRM|nr:M24 family metallopeptidase [Hominibacterium faecale]MCC2865311.1 aminopeptidase P family protein [Anaerovorax odorimutans]MCI7303853.1 aminopeptidase P family protein [Clostridia bacterium]MCO7120965.1 aminopeptidase P family protein [Ihubacter massiliensis]MDE8732855.1 M24 family metallopeptidase [Eubacteriales bacterium DFI.9.88]MDY3011670.1 M24 family metallopeptidase [Clostridiales Family XIII bacterium]